MKNHASWDLLVERTYLSASERVLWSCQKCWRGHRVINFLTWVPLPRGWIFTYQSLHGLVKNFTIFFCIKPFIVGYCATDHLLFWLHFYCVEYDFYSISLLNGLHDNSKKIELVSLYIVPPYIRPISTHCARAIRPNWFDLFPNFPKDHSML